MNKLKNNRSWIRVIENFSNNSLTQEDMKWVWNNSDELNKGDVVIDIADSSEGACDGHQWKMVKIQGDYFEIELFQDQYKIQKLRVSVEFDVY